jgi:winged helix-turn-helix DNA-binding protein
MADLVDRIRKELDARIEQLRPLVGEFERLQRAAAALARCGARSVPGLGSRAPAPAAAKRETEPAGGGSSATRAARTPPAQRRVTASGRTRAPRAQTQAKVLAALRAAPGSTTAAVATATGVPTNTAAAIISRLVKQGRVRRLDGGGYAAVVTLVGAAATDAAPATADGAPGASDTLGAQASATPETQTPRQPASPKGQSSRAAAPWTSPLGGWIRAG